ncbi:MAG: tRNA pseudouridine(55) synthase TruB [Candidatus Magasanikbacteria bacterium]|nr:tRNA pseudouridine(55) synthase TruB [Candidatus Magasanikbacteria bacterium]
MFEEGSIIALYKPVGPSSNQMLTKVKRAINIKKIGHAGTLDPLASGILVVGIGREATKQLWKPEFGEKEYETVITLGAYSTTDDSEGEKTLQLVTEIPTREMVETVINKFVGSFIQQPPTFSALKINGVPAYSLARKGKMVTLGGREVTIHSIELLSYEWPYIALRVHCDSGTYIRSLARDVGAELNVGGFMSSLVRTRVGPFLLKDAVTIEFIESCQAP